MPPPLNASWAAMGRSLGLSSSLTDDARIAALLSRLKDRTLFMIGDSSLRNQFMQLTRVGLSIPRDVPVAKAVATRSYRGSFLSPGGLMKQPERPDSSNGFWGGFQWLVTSTPSNTTIVYAKMWGCQGLADAVGRIHGVMLRHKRHSGGLGGWPPHLVLWNFGLHLLHVFPARPVPTTSIRCALGYGALVEESARTLRAELPSTQLVYRTTNAVCDARFDGQWAVVAHAHHCTSSMRGSSCRTERAARVQDACQRRYNISRDECAATFMDEINTRSQRRSARMRLQTHPARVQLLDAFDITAQRCDATVDGRHYPRLLAAINAQFLASACGILGV